MYLNISIYITTIICLQNYLHLFQLRNYKANRYLSYFNWKYLIFLIFILTVFVEQILISKLIFTILSNICSLFIFGYLSSKIASGNKTPIAWTKRIKILYTISSIILIFPIFFKKIAILTMFLAVFMPIFANLLNFFTKISNINFIKHAQNKLKNSKAKVIAITGSNGKTTVKNILNNMLSTQYKVISTPKSYNTPLGISKFLNEQNLDVDFIILEYGARHKNDIKNLCKLYGADYGIITQISPQHLQTFKTIENIAKAKQQLSFFLKNKPCIFNIDNPFILKMYTEKSGSKISVSTSKSTADYYTQDSQTKNFKTNFDIHFKNHCCSCQTDLLGCHNVCDIALAFALAKHIGVKTANLLSSIKKLKPTPHRLEYLKSNINILDDSYNCSITSAKESISVLKSCSGKHMVVTPGIIEAGKDQFKINFALGQMLTACDYIIIVGQTNKSALTQGINHKTSSAKTATSNNKKILFASNLEHAKQYFKILQKDDTLLLLNDLPDDYS